MRELLFPINNKTLVCLYRTNVWYKHTKEYLDACRTKRNTVEYDYVGGATDRDADELIALVTNLKHEVNDWLKKNHPILLS